MQLITALPLLFLLSRAADAADCDGVFRPGQENFVLDEQDAVKEGAALLATVHAQSAEECERACCASPRCNVALLAPGGAACDLFNCVHRNRFVCRFVNAAGYTNFIREAVFRKHLQGPDEKAPPIGIASRDVIVQPGATVTLSGVESLALGDATITDYDWILTTGNPGVKMEKTDLPDQVKLSLPQPGSYVFQLTVTDSTGQSHATRTTVTVLSPELTSLYCLAPVKVGPCRASFPRWRYDAVSGECVTFLFGGCKQNNNNYLSEDECVSACNGVSAASQRSGSLPSAEECGSPCRPHQLTCGSGCCLHKSLECDGVTQCKDASDETHCSKLNQTFNRLLDIDVNQRKARCSEPPQTGPCRASHARWYYDPLDRKCSRFTYGGCHGNDNNFLEETKCSETCDGVTDRSVFFRGMFERYEKEEEESSSGNIALAVLLSVAILALLAVLGYCFLRRKKKQRSHRPVATSPSHSHAMLSENDTPVYNTTTKPV